MLDDACIFYLAGLPNKTFEVVEAIFELYSVGQLKDQKKAPVDKRLDLKGIVFDLAYTNELTFLFIQCTCRQQLQTIERTRSADGPRAVD